MRRLLIRSALLLTILSALLGFGAQIVGSLSNGDLLAFVAGNRDIGTLYILDLQTGVRLSFESADTRNPPVWSADGRLAFRAFNGNNWDIFVWDEGRVVNVSRNPRADESQPIWSVDGRLAYTSLNQEGSLDVYVWDTETSVNQLVSSIAASEIASSWSPDGQLTIASYQQDNPAMESRWTISPSDA
jgi:hypothetical protein